MCVILPFILDVRTVGVPAGVTQEEGHTGFLHLLSVVLALIFLARRIQTLFSLIDPEVEFCVLLTIWPTLMGTKNLYEKGANPLFSFFFQSYRNENSPDSYSQIRLSVS